MYCQLQRNKENEPKTTELAHKIELTLLQISLGSMDFVVEKLRNEGYKVVILKKSRPESKAGERDSYIIGVQYEQDVIAIKIHPDTFRVCRKVYNKSPLLEQLIEDEDTNHIYTTGTHDGMRFVVYKWDPSPTLQDAIQSKHIPLTNIRHGIKMRVQSLTQKGIFVRATTPEDWIVRPEGDVRLLDLNKAHATRKNSRDMTQITLRNNGVWFRELFDDSRP